MKKDLIKLFNEKCTEETRVFRTLWLGHESARLWEIDQDTVVIRLDRTQDNQMVSTIGLLKNQDAIARLKRAYDDALKDYRLRNDAIFARKMIRAIKKEFIHVDQYIDENEQWHAGGCEDFIPSDERPPR